MTINTREQLIQLGLHCYLQASFVIVFNFDSKRTGLQKQSTRSFLQRIYLKMVQSVTRRQLPLRRLRFKLEQPCQIQPLITDNDTGSEINITTTEHGFNSRTGYPKTTDLER